MPLLTLIYLLTVGLAFITSLRSFRLKNPQHLKVFSVLLGLTFLVEIGAVAFPKFTSVKTNSWLYNSFTLIEFSVYAWYYRRIIHLQRIRKAIRVFQILFPVFWFVTVFFVFGFKAWNSYVIITGAFFTMCFVLAYYYQLLASDDVVDISRHPEFWIATGMLIFYSCQVPYFGMLNYLVENYLLLAKKLLKVLTLINILMYSLFTYAYLCRISTKKSL